MEPLYADTAAVPTEGHQGGVRVHRLRGSAEIRDHIENVAFVTHYEVLGALRLDRLTPTGWELYEYLTFRWLRRGVRIRYLLDPSVLKDASALAYARQISAAGAGVRIAAELKSNLLICDNRSAVFCTNSEDPEDGAVVTREPDLVTVVRDLFSQAWEQAGGLGQVAEESCCLTPADQELLALILKPGKDLARARELGVSLRTFHRRVADLYERLGVSSRTEAALVAREYISA
ncbi:hypothetical protein [Streptomyces sp. NPDC006739]|uniref:hypothetical protein n=1 Tax=Streptomyces sp. NPDC006739 TaxID=3364763 RepID=UPI0036C8BC0D